MSHFSVAVFTDEYTTVDELLEPFDEGIRVEKYIALTKANLIKNGKEKIKIFKRIYKEYMKDKRKYRREHLQNIEHLRFVKRIPSIAKWNDEKIYKNEIRIYTEDEISEDGGIYSTYNPNSKWDWYDIGGRWKDELIIKDEKNNISYKNSAQVKDIRWDLMKEKSKEKMISYEDAIKENEWRKKQFLEMYPTEESYIEDYTRFYTYAVLTPDGKWYEPGKMGWWGISNATYEEEKEFVKNYEEKFIKTANPEWFLTIVDCHI